MDSQVSQFLILSYLCHVGQVLFLVIVFFSSVTSVIFLNFGHDGQVFCGICGMPYVLDFNVVCDQAFERSGRRENSKGEENRLGSPVVSL